MTSATAQAVSTTSTIIEIDPCSNDNPEWDSATQPCPNSITDYIFEGAVTTRPPVTTTTTTTTVEEEIFSTSSTDRDYPTSYSCETNTPSNTQTTPSTDNQQENDDREAIYLKFNYEIYTILNQTQQDINRILGEFESNLGYGVANSLGLTDCQDVSSDNSNNERVGAGNFLIRRSLRKRELEETKDDEGISGGLFAEVSIEPVDIIDTTVCESHYILLSAYLSWLWSKVILTIYVFALAYVQLIIRKRNARQNQHSKHQINAHPSTVSWQPTSPTKKHNVYDNSVEN